MRERCECGKANCVYCNPVDFPARSELLVQIEHLQAEVGSANKKVLAAMVSTRDRVEKETATRCANIAWEINDDIGAVIADSISSEFLIKGREE
jgi:hypothetical protein